MCIFWRGFEVVCEEVAIGARWRGAVGMDFFAHLLRRKGKRCYLMILQLAK